MEEVEGIGLGGLWSEWEAIRNGKFAGNFNRVKSLLLTIERRDTDVI